MIYVAVVVVAKQHFSNTKKTDRDKGKRTCLLPAIEKTVVE